MKVEGLLNNIVGLCLQKERMGYEGGLKLWQLGEAWQREQTCPAQPTNLDESQGLHPRTGSQTTVLRKPRTKQPASPTNNRHKESGSEANWLTSTRVKVFIQGKVRSTPRGLRGETKYTEIGESFLPGITIPKSAPSGPRS